MRCKCCNEPEAQWWKDNYYCHKCKRSITELIREDRYADKERQRNSGSNSSDLPQVQPQGLPNSVGGQKLLSFLWDYNQKGKTNNEL